MTRSAMLRSVLAMLLSFVLSTLAFAQVSEEENTDTDASSVRSVGQEHALDLAQVAKLIVQQTNDLRQQQGLETLERNTTLTQTAQYFADYMARTDRYGHTADGNRPSQRAKEHGYAYCLVAENIAYQYSSVGFGAEELAEKLVEGWKNSPEHRKNMLNGAATETGVAVAHSEDSGHYYAVQMFGRPKSKQIAFQVANQAHIELEYRLDDPTFTLSPGFTRTHFRCRATELAIPGGNQAEKKGKTVQPADGDKVIATREAGQWRVQRQ